MKKCLYKQTLVKRYEELQLIPHVHNVFFVAFSYRVLSHALPDLLLLEEKPDVGERWLTPTGKSLS